MQIEVHSEVGRRKAALLHRPGRELERLTPDYLETMLFEDIPWVDKMHREHEEFASVLADAGCAVYYLQNLLIETLTHGSVQYRTSRGEPRAARTPASVRIDGVTRTREELVRITLALCGLEDTGASEAVAGHLLSLDAPALAETVVTGVEKSEISFEPSRRPLSHYTGKGGPFFVPPLANLYFTRDPAAVLGSLLSISVMKAQARRRESALIGFLAAHHPLFAGTVEVHEYRTSPGHTIEGGDILVLGDSAVAVGCSARTSPGAIEQLALRLFQRGYEQVLAIEIPSARAYMHLDTVLTMVDYDAFSIFTGVEEDIAVYRLEPQIGRGNGFGLRVTPLESLTGALKQAMGVSRVRLIRNASGDALSAAREQWSDSANTLAIAPGKVIAYNRNVGANRELRKHGIEVVEIEGSELVRGRGGPRCMSMPLVREK